MHPVDLIGLCIEEPLPEEPREGVCAVTGELCQCISRKTAFGGSKLSMSDILHAPNSDMVGVNAYKTMARKETRRSSWFCDGKEFRLLDRIQVRDIVIAGDYPPVWVGYATTNHKKHGALYATVNSPGKAIWRFENIDVDCSNRDRLTDIWTRLNDWLRRGISRPCLESVEANTWALKAVGISGWLDFERWAKPNKLSPIYQFLCYLLPNQKELKGESA